MKTNKALLLALATFGLALAACGGGGEASSSATSSSSAATSSASSSSRGTSATSSEVSSEPAVTSEEPSSEPAGTSSEIPSEEPSSEATTEAKTSAEPSEEKSSAEPVTSSDEEPSEESSEEPSEESSIVSSPEGEDIDYDAVFFFGDLKFRFVKEGDDPVIEILGLAEESEASIIEVPASIEVEGTEFPVRKIGNNAFDARYQITKITIAEGITSIGDYAFCDLYQLAEISLPDSIEHIGYGAFYYCEGLTFNIEDGGKYLGGPENPYLVWMGFDGVTPESFEIREGARFIGDGVAEGDLNIKSIVVPASVREIGAYSFSNCTYLTSIDLSHVTRIGEAAFSWCEGLTSVTLSSDLEYVGDEAFSNTTNLAGYEENDLVYLGNSTSTHILLLKTTNRKASSVNINPMTRFIADKALTRLTTATQIRIPDGVISIGREALADSYCITQITVPDSVRHLGSKAFAGGYALERVTFGLGLEEIPDNVCLECGNLTTVVLPEGGLRKIGYRAFEKCYSLNDVVVPEGVVTIENDAFINCSALTNITLPTTLKTIGSDAFSGSAIADFHWNIASIDKWLQIEGKRFADRNVHLYLDGELLTEVTMPIDYVSVPDYAFHYCADLTSVILTDNIRAIGANAFKGCDGLTNDSIKYGEGLETIGVAALASCNGLTQAIIPDGVTEVENSAFEYCTNLTSVVFPASLTKIDVYCFYFCQNIEKVYYKGTAPYSATLTIRPDGNYLVRNESIWYYFTENGEGETASGQWWYYDASGTIVEKVNA
ncbi:MAG: leucine-rich repeat protein [Bacilli bacterium]|nr:leucine-rich repeat protein [Bacilli bacterium]